MFDKLIEYVAFQIDWWGHIWLIGLMFSLPWRRYEQGRLPIHGEVRQGLQGTDFYNNKILTT